jgi:hypothetical protein
MTKPIHTQVNEAKEAYFRAVSKAPRSQMTIKLLYRFQQLRFKQLKLEIRQERTA